MKCLDLERIKEMLLFHLKQSDYSVQTTRFHPHVIKPCAMVDNERKLYDQTVTRKLNQF